MRRIAARQAPGKGSPWNNPLVPGAPATPATCEDWPPPARSTCGLLVGASLVEDDRAVAVEQDTVLGVPADRPGERLAFHVPADRRHLVGGHRVVDPGDLLLDDRALVQAGGDVVGSRPDHLDAAVVSLMVGTCPLEAGQHGVVDVDHTSGQLLA